MEGRLAARIMLRADLLGLYNACIFQSTAFLYLPLSFSIAD